MAGNALSEAMYEARRILIDEGPQLRDTLIKRVIPFIPPGRAHRKYEDREPGRKGTRYNWDDSQKIKSGARSLIDGSLHSAEQRGVIERHKKDGQTYLAITEWGRAQFERYYRRGE